MRFCSSKIIAVLFAGVVPGAFSAAAQNAPKAESIPETSQQNSKQDEPAREGSSKPPQQLVGKSVTIKYDEARTNRPQGGGPVSRQLLPFTLIVYVSKEGNLFNRLDVGSFGKSDQTRGSRDATAFSERRGSFDGRKMSKSSRDIIADFDENFSRCTGRVVTAIDGDFVLQRKITGGFVELLSAKAENVTCKIADGNALAN